MRKNKILLVALSVLSVLALGLGITALGVSSWYPPGGSTVP